ncbi:hypothetical protein AcV5_006365 [Taiwanofungus camphoratus]|nr:hypothetical protein AcV5_006365 [Antrodia cinnamomea]
MTGPPTPPLTTPAEIEDAARNSVPPQVAPIPSGSNTTVVASQAEPPQRESPPISAEQQDTYESLFPLLIDLAAKGEFKELVRVAEHGDMSARNDAQYTRLFIVAPLVLSYLTLDELSAARYALQRLPDNLASLPLSQALFGLMASVWERRHGVVYSRAEDLFSLCQQPGIPDATLGAVLGGMVNAFVEVFRKKTFTLLAKAYTSITVPLAGKYLGLSAEQVLTAAAANGWQYDSSTQLLTPTVATTSRWDGATSAPSTLVTFNLVADSVARLEA